MSYFHIFSGHSEPQQKDERAAPAETIQHLLFFLEHLHLHIPNSNKKPTKASQQQTGRCDQSITLGPTDHR